MGHMWLSPGQRLKWLENLLLENTARHLKRPPCHLFSRHPLLKCHSSEHHSSVEPSYHFHPFLTLPHHPFSYHVQSSHRLLTCNSPSLCSQEPMVQRCGFQAVNARVFLLNFMYVYCKYDKYLKGKYQEWVNKCKRTFSVSWWSQ